MSQIVYDADGKAGILCGENSEGQETVVWLSVPTVVGAEVDDKGNGTPAYSDSQPPVTEVVTAVDPVVPASVDPNAPVQNSNPI